MIFAGLLAVVLLGAVAAGPWAYKTFVERPPEPVLALPSGAQPAATDVNGSWTVQPGSLVGYRVQQQLLWEMVDVNGRTDAVTGGAEIRESRLVSADFTVDVGTFDSGRPGRDERFRGTDVMDSASFPTATVRMNTPVDLAAIPEDGAAARLEVPVHLTLKGVTRRETAQIEVHQLETPGIDIRTSRNAAIPASSAFRIVRPLSPPTSHDRLTRWSNIQLTFATDCPSIVMEN